MVRCMHDLIPEARSWVQTVYHFSDNHDHTACGSQPKLLRRLGLGRGLGVVASWKSFRSPRLTDMWWPITREPLCPNIRNPVWVTHRQSEGLRQNSLDIRVPCF